MQALLKLADAIEAVLRRIADAGAWAFIACIAVITLDVVTRKFGFQVPGMGSTRLQELEWHLHAVLFCTWLGYAYVRNAHVRIDVFIGGLTPRAQAVARAVRLPAVRAALPVGGAAVRARLLPASRSRRAKSSDAPTGLPSRWIIKGFLCLGLRHRAGGGAGGAGALRGGAVRHARAGRARLHAVRAQGAEGGARRRWTG